MYGRVFVCLQASEGENASSRYLWKCMLALYRYNNLQVVKVIFARTFIFRIEFQTFVIKSICLKLKFTIIR